MLGLARSGAPVVHRQFPNIHFRLGISGGSRLVAGQVEVRSRQVTSRYETENFVHHAAINACAQALHLACNLAAPYGLDDDVLELLTAELNQHAPQNAKWGCNKVKAWLADAVVPAMDAQMLGQIDPAGEMRGWMTDIELMLAPLQAPQIG